ncbi:hypothetical protein BGZ65_001399 [Modicella reniformis]|uniref:Peptidase C19 ubiquitin carboxyl-terminal hydrolase domain-containing protein n=1 Tax=Modicella reniformis TaxID=1440133 RepID=A0A9P6LUD0_9FUNG|nr:hypothetical protein BGZ65_001399 [Modicella reniformis]
MCVACTHTAVNASSTIASAGPESNNNSFHRNPSIRINSEKNKGKDKDKSKHKPKDKDAEKNLKIDGSPHRTKTPLKRSRSPIKLLRNIKTYLHVHKQKYTSDLSPHYANSGNNNSLVPPMMSHDGAGHQCRLFPSSSIVPANRLSKESLTPEKQVLLLQVMSYFEHVGHPEDEETAEHLLKSYQWNIDQTMQYCQDLVQAFQGVLVPIQQETKLNGAVNDQMTSCYIDALFFAMFARLSAFEGLLNVNLDTESDSESDCSNEAVGDSRKEEVRQEALLQTWLRMFVNQLRSGRLIQAHVVKVLRELLYSCGWNCPGPFDPPGSSRQEDVSELFMFLTEKLHLPYLPLEQRLLHGARMSADDEKVITERMLQISIPMPEPQEEPPRSPTAKLESVFSNLFTSKVSTNDRGDSGSLYEVLSLENLLAQHFYDNTLTGIRRKVSSGTGVPLSPGVEVPVSAWQVLELLPFYSSLNEQGGIIHASQSQYPENVVILPLILKRYSFGADMQARKINTPIDIPRRIDFSRFVNRQTSGSYSTTPSPPPSPSIPQDTDNTSSSNSQEVDTLTVTSKPLTIMSAEPEDLPTIDVSSPVHNLSAIDTRAPPIRKYSMSLLQAVDSPRTPITPPRQYSPAATKEFQHLSELVTPSYVADTVGKMTPTPSQDGMNGDTTPHPLSFQEPNWLRHDDLDPSGQRVQLIPNNSPEDMDMEADWARNGYILFYELQTIQC